MLESVLLLWRVRVLLAHNLIRKLSDNCGRLLKPIVFRWSTAHFAQFAPLWPYRCEGSWPDVICAIGCLLFDLSQHRLGG